MSLYWNTFPSSFILPAFPVFVAKTQYPFSTDPQLRGTPSCHVINVCEVRRAADTRSSWSWCAATS
jgi:formyltetrahydrofolate synthetase